MGDLRGRTLAERLAMWKKTLRVAAVEEHCAEDVYMGDHWSVVRSIPSEAEKRGLKVNIWICSAGYGLIRPRTQIKGYRATFTRGEQDYVASGLAGDGSELGRWWRGVCTYKFSSHVGEPRTISELAATFPRTPLLVALSADYLKAVATDLEAVLDVSYFREHLAIISSGTPSDHPIWKQNLLPCDASLREELGGAMTSLNARVARRLLRGFDQKEMTVERLATLTSAIERRPRTLRSRIAMSDSEIANFVRLRLSEEPECSKTALLRAFRAEGQACEQGRFGDIYSRVSKEVAK